MEIVAVDPAHAERTCALLGALNVSLFGIQSAQLRARLVDDAIRKRIEGRIAIDRGEVIGVVMAAPAWYWWWLPLRHWGIAREIASARMRRRPPAVDARRGSRYSSAAAATASRTVTLSDRPPQYDWRRPGPAWRVIFIGTSPAARGRGVAAALYRHLMTARPLVARIALDNAPSLYLHASTGWSLHRDEGVVLAVHELPPRLNGAPAPAAAPREAGR